MKFYGRYGNLIKHYEVSLSQMLHDILRHDHIYIYIFFGETLNWSDITTICELSTELDLIIDFNLITKFREVSIEHCNGCGAASQ